MPLHFSYKTCIVFVPNMTLSIQHLPTCPYTSPKMELHNIKISIFLKSIAHFFFRCYSSLLVCECKITYVSNHFLSSPLGITICLQPLCPIPISFHFPLVFLVARCLWWDVMLDRLSKFLSKYPRKKTLHQTVNQYGTFSQNPNELWLYSSTSIELTDVTLYVYILCWL